jgi:ureidoglycolate hydrolase
LACYGSIVVSRPLVVCINSGSLLRYMRLASFLTRKSNATNLVGFVCCVPALFNTSAIGFHFPNVTWS